jgi:hypothetical protein
MHLGTALDQAEVTQQVMRGMLSSSSVRFSNSQHVIVPCNQVRRMKRMQRHCACPAGDKVSPGKAPVVLSTGRGPGTAVNATPGSH